jgi:hypothetical protein
VPVTISLENINFGVAEVPFGPPGPNGERALMKVLQLVDAQSRCPECRGTGDEPEPAAPKPEGDEQRDTEPAPAPEAETAAEEKPRKKVCRACAGAGVLGTGIVVDVPMSPMVAEKMGRELIGSQVQTASPADLAALRQSAAQRPPMAGKGRPGR